MTPRYPALLLWVGASIGWVASPGCGQGEASPTPTTTPSPGGCPGATRGDNVLIVIADDLGVGASVCHSEGDTKPPSPTVEALCQRGVVFTQAWSQPVCSSTRASTLTGRYAWRTGVGAAIDQDNPVSLSLDEWTLPELVEMLAPEPYRHACIGKWHVGPGKDTYHPVNSGFSHYQGLLSGAVESYTSWAKTQDGQTSTSTAYVTSDNVDDAVAWACAQTGPWVLWLALVSPHDPLHLPPAALHSSTELSGTEQDIDERPLEYYHAMIEAMDTELGRLFEGLGSQTLEHTHVFYLGDNGPSNRVARAPDQPGKVKDTLYQGGLHVPLVYAGPAAGSPGLRVDTPVHVVDVLPTVLELVGAQLTEAQGVTTLDGLSLVPLLRGETTLPRAWILSELFSQTSDPARHGKAARDATYKLIRWESGQEALFDLSQDPAEASDLLLTGLSPEAQASYASLSLVLDEIPRATAW